MKRATTRILRTLGIRARWRYRRIRWKARRRRRTLRRALSSPRVATSQTLLIPFVVLMVASAAVLDADGSEERFMGRQPGPVFTAADRALAPYREVRDQMVARYAVVYGVPRRLAALIHETAAEERIDPELAFRLVRTESSFHPMAVGPAGAIGLAQVRPSTARWLDSTITRERLFEAETNLRLGFRYLRMLLDMHDHDRRLALLAYNRGPGTVAALLAIGEDPGNGYASRVLGARSVTRSAAASVRGDDAPGKASRPGR